MRVQPITKPTDNFAPDNLYYNRYRYAICITYNRRVWINRVRLPILLLVVSCRGKMFFTCPRSRLRIWSRETGSAVPPRVSLLIILHTQAESGAYYSRDSSRFPRRRPITNRHRTPSGQSRVYRVTQFRTDGVHKVLPVPGAAFTSPWTNYLCAPLFSHTHYDHTGILQ